jgi:hypothetical protein
MKLTSSIILAILTISMGCYSHALNSRAKTATVNSELATPNRKLTTCTDNTWLNAEGTCVSCQILVPHCKTCTPEGICESCQSPYEIADAKVKDTADPKNAPKRDVKQCITLPFFSSWYGILLLIFIPLLVGGGVAMLIKLIAQKKQQNHDKMKKAQEAKKREGSRNNTLNDYTKNSANKITPIRTSENSANPKMMKIEKDSLEPSTNVAAKGKDGFGNPHEDSDFDEI